MNLCSGMNGVPGKCQVYPRPPRVALFGSRVSAEVIKMRGYWR